MFERAALQGQPALFPRLIRVWSWYPIPLPSSPVTHEISIPDDIIVLG